jgi:hypothetical protein
MKIAEEIFAAAPIAPISMDSTSRHPPGWFFQYWYSAAAILAHSIRTASTPERGLPAAGAAATDAASNTDLSFGLFIFLLQMTDNLIEVYPV